MARIDAGAPGLRDRLEGRRRARRRGSRPGSGASAASRRGRGLDDTPARARTARGHRRRPRRGGARAPERAYVSSTDVPLLHPAFVAAVIAAAAPRRGRGPPRRAGPPAPARGRVSHLAADRGRAADRRGPHAARLPVRTLSHPRADRGRPARRPCARPGRSRPPLAPERERPRRVRASTLHGPHPR